MPFPISMSDGHSFEAFSKDGKPYTYGGSVPKEDPVEIDPSYFLASPGNSVSWEPLNPPEWKAVSDEVKEETGIEKYRLSFTPSDDKSKGYRLEVNVSGFIGGHKSYNFGDKEGDMYGLTCWTEGTHHLDYHSTDGAISVVKAKSPATVGKPDYM